MSLFIAVPYRTAWTTIAIYLGLQFVQFVHSNELDMWPHSCKDCKNKYPASPLIAHYLQKCVHFFPLQIVHIKHKGQTSKFQPCYVFQSVHSNKPIIELAITQDHPKLTEKQKTIISSNLTVKKNIIDRLSIRLSHAASISDDNTSLSQIFYCQNLIHSSCPPKESHSWWNFTRHILFHGKFLTPPLSISLNNLSH